LMGKVGLPCSAYSKRGKNSSVDFTQEL